MSGKAKSISPETAANIRGRIVSATGYCRPPEHSRFQKGKSGNPAGRPRKQQAPSAAVEQAVTKTVLKESRRTVRAREDGAVTEMTALEGVTRAQIKAALQGNAYAQKNFIDRCERAERQEAERIALLNQAAEHYKINCMAEIDLARAEGRPVPEFYPHPDDVIVEVGKPFRIIGPRSPQEYAKCQEDCDVIDVLLMQAALDRYPPKEQQSSELAAAHILNICLPRRMQLDENEMLRRLYRYQHGTRRDLLKAIRQAWRRLGKSVPRGARLPAIECWKEPFDALAQKLSGL